MNSLYVYIVVILVYIAVLFVVGIITGKKTKSSADFHIGGRNIGPWVTALSFVAAYFSSVVIVGGGGFGYKFGMATLWIGAINVLVGTLISWIVLGPKIREYTQKLKTVTIPGFLKARFNSNFAMLFSSIVIVIFMIVYNVSILKGMGHIFEVLIGIPYIYGVIIASVIILFYVSIGGYLAVVWTSFIQAWVMGIGLVLLTIFSVKYVGGITAANIALENINPGLLHTPGVWGWQGLLSFALIVSFGVWGMPQLVVRFYSIKKLSFFKIGTVVAVIGTCLALLPYFNGAIAHVIMPNLKNPDLAIPMLTKRVLSPFGASLVLAAVVAAGMSTFASILIIITSTFVQDILKTGFKRKLSDKKALIYGKLASLTIGIISLLIAFRPPALILTLTAFAWASIASTTLWPILFGLYWKKANKWGVIASMLGGFSTAMIWMLLKNPYKIHGFIPGIVVGFVLMVFISLLVKENPYPLK